MFSISNNKGFHVTFENGWTVSVQFGGGNYCDNYDETTIDWPTVPPCSNAEIAGFKGDDWHHFDDCDNTVSGYRTSADVLAFMNMIAAK